MVDAARIGISPTVANIAPIDFQKSSAWFASAKKNGGTVKKSSSILAFVKLPDQIGWPVTWDMTWYPTANIRARGTHPEAIVPATQTIPVMSSASPKAFANLEINNA